MAEEDKTKEAGKEQVKPEKQEIARNPDGTFPPGVSGNPAGRPKGMTIKERVRKWLEEHPDDMDAFVRFFVKENRDLTWQMLEGRPQQDVTTDGKALPTPILGGISVPNAENKGTDS